jgi:hypothetical protein
VKLYIGSRMNKMMMTGKLILPLKKYFVIADFVLEFRLNIVVDFCLIFCLIPVKGNFSDKILLLFFSNGQPAIKSL